MFKIGLYYTVLIIKIFQVESLTSVQVPLRGDQSVFDDLLDSQNTDISSSLQNGFSTYEFSQPIPNQNVSFIIFIFMIISFNT